MLESFTMGSTGVDESEQGGLRLSSVSKRYTSGGGVTDISLHVPPGDMHVLLGPSGCGKTTLLRAIAGLVDLDAGRIELDGRDLTHTPVHKRAIGMVFQRWALFPHMTVAKNVAFGLKMAGLRGEEVRRRVADVLELVRLEDFGDRLPDGLSGGQQQRVALARAIVTRPHLLLLDEPLSSLDHQIRLELRTELRSLQHDLRITGVYVTHDYEEALALGDHITVLDGGSVVESGPARTLFRRPESEYAARFLSVGNVLPVEEVRRSDLTAAVTTPIGPAEIEAGGRQGRIERVCIPFDAVSMTEEGLSGSAGAGARIQSVEYVSAGIRCVMRGATADWSLVAVRPPTENWSIGTPVDVVCDWTRVFPVKSQAVHKRSNNEPESEA